MSLFVPDLTCGFVHENSVLTSGIASLYRTKTSSVDLCKQNHLLSTRLTNLYGSQTSPVDLCMQNNVLSSRITSL